MEQTRRDAKKFGRLLKTAIRKIALLENKNIALVQDELGYAMGRETGGASIQFWERGNIPAKHDDTEKLKQMLVELGGLSAAEVAQFVCYAGFPAASASQRRAFIAGPPIRQPHHFFGRDYELKRLFGLWRYDGVPLQNAAIIGPRGSGKTSLLLHLKDIATTPLAELRPGQRGDWLLQPERYRWVFVDFRSPQFSTQAGLLRYLLTALNLAVPTPCNLDRFVEVVSRNLQSPIVILLDELGVALERYAELNDAFWDGLRALACTMMNGNLAFVLSTREIPSQLARRTHRSSDFFSIFAYTARLGPLTEAEALELISSSPLLLPPADIDWILSHSQRWPLLTQILCRERLMALEEGETSIAWREEGLRQIAPFQDLLD